MSLNSHIIYVKLGTVNHKSGETTTYLKIFTYDLTGRRVTKALDWRRHYDVDEYLRQHGLAVVGHNFWNPDCSIIVCEWDLAKLRTVFS